MQQPPSYATNRRVGCVMWLSILAIVMSGVGLLADLTQEMAWDRRVAQLNELYASIYVSPESKTATNNTTAIAQQPVPIARAVEFTLTTTSISSATETPTETLTPPPTFTPLPTWTPVPAAVNPRDARDSLFVHGNGSPQLPTGEQGVVTIISVGKIETSEYSSQSILPIVVRNNTGSRVSRIGVSSTARDSSGAILAAGGDQGITPNLIQPGEIAFGYIYFSDVKLPEGTRFDFQTEYSSAGDSIEEFENIRDLEITEVTLVENRVVGLIRNQYNEIITGPISLEMICFDSNQLLKHYRGYADQDTLSAGVTVSYQFELDKDICPTYLVTGSGYIN